MDIRYPKYKRLNVASGRVFKDNGDFINIASVIKDVFADQAGRVRVSTPEPLGDYKLINDRLPQFFDTEVNGTGEVTYSATHKAHDMNTTAAGDWAIVQTYQRHNYFAGKAQFVETTSFLFDAQDGVEKRAGYYSSSTTTPFTANLDGFYLSARNGTHYLTIVNNGVTIADIARADWNDPLDGTGPSAHVIDWDKFNVFQFNFLWLGGTGLRFSLIVGSNSYLVHEYIHIGSLNSDKLIFGSPNKPIRYEIRQSGADAGRFLPVCATVASEGSESSANIGDIRSIDTAAANIITASYPDIVMVKGVRLKETHIDAIIDVLDVNVFIQTVNDFYRWALILNPTVTGTPVWTDVADTSTQEANGTGAITLAGGQVLRSGYGSSRATGGGDFRQARKIGAAIDGTRDELYLAVQPLQGSTNLNLFGSITFKSFV